MMAVDVKRLSEAEKVGPTDRQTAALDKARAVSRRSQALLAAAGEEVPGKAWIVARVAPRCDNAVENAFRSAGLDSWVPVVKVEPTYRGGRRKHEPALVEKPVWPGYLFVRTVMSPRAWAGLFTVDGVLALLGSAGLPIPVKAEEVSRLRGMLARDEAIKDRVENRLRAGDKVVVREGPFASFPGVAACDEQGGRAVIDVMIFGRETPVELSLAQIRKLG